LLSVSKVPPTRKRDFLAGCLVTTELLGAELSSTSHPVPAAERESERASKIAETRATTDTAAAANLGTQGIEVIFDCHEKTGTAPPTFGNRGGTRCAGRNSCSARSIRWTSGSGLPAG